MSFRQHIKVTISKSFKIKALFTKTYSTAHSLFIIFFADQVRSPTQVVICQFDQGSKLQIAKQTYFLTLFHILKIYHHLLHDNFFIHDFLDIPILSTSAILNSIIVSFHSWRHTNYYTLHPVALSPSLVLVHTYRKNTIALSICLREFGHLHTTCFRELMSELQLKINPGL